MDRNAWINERIHQTEKRMDELSAPTYDEDWGDIEITHEEELRTMLRMLSNKSFILDAACGTGKYWQILLEKNNHILGIDNSGEMLKKALQKYPDVPTEKMQLQEINFKEKFDGIICIDAMECIVPEYWLIIMKRFYQALKEEGKIYLTVELEDEEELKKNFQKNLKNSLPVIIGEYYENGGYHYYPKISQVKEWIQQANLSIIREREEQIYYHFILSR